MDWLDYRKKLKIGFNDEEKVKYFFTKMFNILDDVSDNTRSQIKKDEYFVFCNMTGSKIQQDGLWLGGYEQIVNELHNHCSSLEDFLSYYVAFLNCQRDDDTKPLTKEQYKNILLNFLEESHLYFEVFEDKDGYFIFPKGAEELDNALVSDILIWLISYPITQKTYVTALKQYAEGIYIRDVADNLRKALESFLQEFLGNTKNLETNKNEICKYLGSIGVDHGVVGLFQPLINAYKNINDRIAKHNDKVDKNILEFLLYQTGVLIRMILVIDMDNKEKS